MKTINQPTISTSKFGLRAKLLIGFGIILSILLIAISISLIKTTYTEELASQTLNFDLPTYDAQLDLYGQLNKSLAMLNGWLVTQDPKFKELYATSWVAINNSQNKLDKLADSTTFAAKNDWQLIKPLLFQLKTVEDKIISSSATSTNNSAITTELMPVYNRILDIIDGPIDVAGDRKGGMFDKQYVRLSDGTQLILSDMNMLKFIEYLLLFTGICLGLLIAYITANSILKPLNRAIDIAQTIADGNRDVNIEVTSEDETGQLLKALNIMQASIKENDTSLKENEEKTKKLFDNIVQTASAYSIHSSKVAAGDLTQRININSNDEMSRLGKDLNTMTEGLANITKQITNACHNMVTTLDEVKHVADVQSSGAAEQASSINQITASLEEIEKSSTQTIEKAKMLGEVAERTRTKGQLGLESVEQSVTGMKNVRAKVEIIAQTILDLSNQTQQIGEITAVVNTLAQQSKMLALNASIEAAKAGEAGKGFAVVAAEVKNLAEQSEQSTTQVQKILEDIRHATEKAVIATEEGTKGVDYGTTLVEKTGEVVRSLSEVIHEATIASQQIEAAIRQEGIGIEQIAAGMNEINQVTSSSVETVKQTTEAIDNLSVIAKSLKEQIDIYKL